MNDQKRCMASGVRHRRGMLVQPVEALLEVAQSLAFLRHLLNELLIGRRERTEDRQHALLRVCLRWRGLALKRAPHGARAGQQPVEADTVLLSKIYAN